MNARIIIFCLALAPLIVSCRFHHYSYTSTTTSRINDDEYSNTLKNQNGVIDCTYTYKSGGHAYVLKSNGPLKINNGTVETLRHGQTIELAITEASHDYHYTISQGFPGIKMINTDGPLLEADQARIRWALEAVQKQLSGSKHQLKAAQDQAENARKQAAATQAQMQRQAEALQRQAEAFQRQAQRQSEALQKQAEALQKQAQDFERQLAR